MKSAINICGLTHRFGEVVALDRVECHVARGEIFGYLGPNGAGKTTTINILTGLLEPDAGEVTIAGLRPEHDSVEIKRQIGLVPEESNLYPELSCRRNLEYLGELYGLKRQQRRERSSELLTQFDLAAQFEKPFRALSRGMKRRLTLAAALMHSPEILFLDEPTAGLDVPGARALRALLQRIHKSGTTIFLTTHNLAEAEQLCDHIAILVRGKVLASGTTLEVQEHVEHAGKRLTVSFSGEVDRAVLQECCSAVTSVERPGDAWRLGVTDVHRAVVQLSSFAERRNLSITGLTSDTGNLEDAFMSILTHETEAGEES